MRLTPILFLLLPFVELYGLIRVGGSIGALTTVFLVIMTAIFGFWLLKKQGNSVSSNQIEMMRKLTSAPLVILGAVLLIIPGVLTDTFGALLVFPPTRNFFKWILMNHFGIKVGKAKAKVNEHDEILTEASSVHRQKKGHTIEGEYTKE